MRILSIIAAMAIGIASQAAAGGMHHGHGHGHQRGVERPIIYVSCFRGPWKEVIWDHPNAKFVDSLVGVGYDFPTAHAIAERVCRDATIVGNNEGLKSTMLRIYHESPAYRRQHH